MNLKFKLPSCLLLKSRAKFLLSISMNISMSISNGVANLAAILPNSKVTKSPSKFISCQKNLLFLFVATLSWNHNLNPRNYFRGIDPTIPYIEVQWADQPSTDKNNPIYTLRDSHLKERPLFRTFERDYFMQKLIPNAPIPYRSDLQQNVSGAILTTQVENFLKELRQLKKLPRTPRMRSFKNYFTDFEILKSNEFYFKSFSGLVVAKFKKYPFIVKLLIEDPHSITSPYNRGLYSMGIFTLSGTVRHTIGFSRVHNSEDITAKAATDPRWANHLTVPKKWFWLPKNHRWLKITGHDIGIHGTQSIEVPAIYAVIAEEINCSSNNCKPNPKECLDASNFLKCATDPNYSNFRIEDSSGKLAIIDTENFPLMMGVEAEQIRPFKTYKGFYSRVSIRFMHRKLFQDKRARRKNQFKE